MRKQSTQGTKEYTVTVEATGGTGPEDLTADIVIGANTGDDYSSSPDQNKTGKPSQKQLIVQARVDSSTKETVFKILMGASLSIFFDW